MAKSGNWFESKTGKRSLALMYGLGAAIVILGALFKLQHWPGAGLMLTLGLSTEAVIFAVGAFLPIHDDPDWTLVYPELAGSGDSKKKGKGDEVARLNDMLEKAKLKQETFTRLGEGMQSLNKSVEGLKVANDATVATQAYTKKVQDATGNLDNLNKSYAVAAKSISTLGDSQKVSNEFYNTMKNVTSKLTQLNSVYELELKESNDHSKALGDYHKSMSSLITNITATEQGAAQMKNEVTKLAKNLASLNSVYGNMLNAMAQSK